MPPMPPPRTTDQSAFDRLFAEGRRALSEGTHRYQKPPVDGSPRWGISALMRPDTASAAALDLITHQAAATVAGSHWTTGASTSSHLTLRSLESFRETVPPGDPKVARYAAALRTAMEGIGPIRFTVTGLTLTAHSVMACAIPANTAADDLATAYGEALGADGWHEREFNRDLWYLNLIHFAEPVQRPAELISYVDARRTTDLADILVTEVQIAQWRHSLTGMLPVAHASVAPGHP